MLILTNSSGHKWSNIVDNKQVCGYEEKKKWMWGCQGKNPWKKESKKEIEEKER